MPELNIEVLYEDNHLIAVNKPYGMLVQTDGSNDMSLEEVTRDFIREKYNKPGNVFCGVIHRLDRPVSGTILMAKTSKGLERMNALFRERKVEKTYWALVADKPEKEEDTLFHYLLKDTTKNRTSVHTKKLAGSVYAELSYKLIGRVAGHYLLEVKPVTGRPHQIRAQLARIGCSIVGDTKYRFPKRNKEGYICLHSRSLSFIHPIKKEPVYIEANVPFQAPMWQKFREF